MGADDVGALRDIEVVEPQSHPLADAVGAQFQVGAVDVYTAIKSGFLGIIRTAADGGTNRRGVSGTAAATAVYLNGFAMGIGVSIIAGVATWEVMEGSLSSQSTSAQMPSPSISRFRGRC